MTELSPVGIVNTPTRRAPLDTRGDEPQRAQGRPLAGIELHVVDDDGRTVPHDGRSRGELLVRGHWICRNYFRGEGGDPLRDGGWFPTGDVATIDADGFLQIVDRTKDLVKSGGEWISSIELENAVAAHAAIAQAAVIGVPHEKWGERPLVAAVMKPGHSVTAPEIIRHLESRVPKWWLPEDVVFVTALPVSRTGKVQKIVLRETYRGHCGVASRPG